MLIQVGIPRPRFDVGQFPQHLVLHTLAKPGVSTGEVRLNGTIDPEHGVRGSRLLDPWRTYPIEGEQGFEGYEFVVPFWELFQRREVRRELLAETGASGYGSLAMVPFVTGGFIVTAHSAFRATPTSYEENVLSLTVLMPVSGGGVLRLSDSRFDIANPTFDPYAPWHGIQRLNLEHQQALNRAHAGRSASLEARKAERVRAAEAAMAAEQKLLPSGDKS